jgi:hypothetical protein
VYRHDHESRTRHFSAPHAQVRSSPHIALPETRSSRNTYKKIFAGLSNSALFCSVIERDEVRLKAIEIANALLEEGYDEGRAIRIAIEEVRQGREMALVPVITDSFAPFKTFENRGEFQSFQRFAPLPDVRGWRPPKSSRQIRGAVPHSQRIATSK